MARAKKSWLLAEYWACSKTLELAQSALLEAGAIGIEIDDGISPEHAPKYEPEKIRVLAYFEEALGLEEEIKESLSLFFSNCGLESGPVAFSRIYEEDWQGNFVRSCTTFMVEPRIFVVPSFEIDEFKKNQSRDLFIEMDPENAFGTGQHQTTKLCLKHIALLLENMPPPKRSMLSAIDVGTGSGILAILMKKLGAGSVIATEIDVDAVLTARKNAEKNNVVIDVVEVREAHSYPAHIFDLVVANILAPTLIDMAKDLTKACKDQGTIILSGILLAQKEKVIKAYEDLGARLVKHDAMDDWCALIFSMDLCDRANED